MKTQLYRHFNKNGVLLYVGVSLCAVARLVQHREHSHWFKSITRVEIEMLDSREAAVMAERNAILTEKPRWNLSKVPTEKRRPDVSAETLRERVVEFKPMYTLKEVKEVLRCPIKTIVHWMDTGQMSYVEVPMSRGTNKKRLVTGWQLLDFIDNLQAQEQSWEPEKPAELSSVSLDD